MQTEVVVGIALKCTKEKVPPRRRDPSSRTYSTLSSTPTLTDHRISDPCPADPVGRASVPGGSDPAVAGRASGHRLAAGLVSAQDSDFAGQDSGSDWTLPSPSLDLTHDNSGSGFWLRRNSWSGRAAPNPETSGGRKVPLYNLLASPPALLPHAVPAVRK